MIMKIKNKEDKEQISATEFKKHFLQLVDQVTNQKNSFTITKRKIPVAKIVPLDDDKTKKNKTFFGCMKGTTTIKGDIVNCSFDSEWEINND